MKQTIEDDLAELAELFEAGKVVPVIDRSYPLGEVPEAVRYLEEGRALGKVVIYYGGEQHYLTKSTPEQRMDLRPVADPRGVKA